MWHILEKQINTYRIFVGNPKGKRPTGRPKRKYNYNIKLDLRERRLNFVS